MKKYTVVDPLNGREWRVKITSPAGAEVESYRKRIDTLFDEFVHGMNVRKADNNTQGKSRGNLSQTGNTSIQEEVVICDVCEEQIINMQWERSDWQTFCTKHESDETPICCSCSRFKIKNIEFITLNDGRKLCPDCRSTAILDSESCNALVSEIKNFFGGLNMHIGKDIPVLLVDQIEINRVFDDPEEDPKQVTLGVTTFKEMEAITCVKGSSQSGRNIEVVKQVENLPRHCSVTSMLLLYGYPKLAIGATLAHEMMHTWMRLEGYPKLEDKVEEGISELMAYKYLDSYDFIGEDMNGADERSQFMRNFKEYLKNQMEGNDCKVYGDGFREAKLAVETHGFEYTMQCITDTGKFP